MLENLIGKTDIYLLDQIMKDRYSMPCSILDAGCGNGRNMFWFLQNDFDIYGIDINDTAIQKLKLENKFLKENQFQVADITNIPFPNQYFNHIICSAVLHFAKSTSHFLEMLSELNRVLKTNGTLFIRMTSDIGIADKLIFVSESVYKMPDGDTRFILTSSLINKILTQYNYSLLEPVKTVNVNNERCMTTLILLKN